jgi:hypothetical protein
MTDGYDARQSGRQSFAFTPQAPVQGSTAASAGSPQRIQVEGGESRGGNPTNQITEPAPQAGELGEYFGKLLEPYVQKKQDERFWSGVSAARSGIALDELDHSNKGINKIFGPSSFEEGAMMYAATTAINQWSVDMDADMDNLKRMSREDAAKVVAAKSNEMLTGHPGADQIIQKGIFQASGPMLTTIAKEQYAFGQQRAKAAVSQSWATGADALQATVVRQLALSDPSDPSHSAQAEAMRNFAQSMVKPHGMDDDSYRDSLVGFMRNAAQNGNGYAITAMKQAGVMDVLDDEERTKLEDSVLRYGNKAIGEAALELGPRIVNLHRDELWGKHSALSAMAEVASINAEAKRRTGFDIDLIDAKEAVGEGKNVMSALRAAYVKQEDHKWEMEDKARERKWKLDDDAAEIAGKAAQIKAMWGGGNIKLSVAMGIGSQSNYDGLAYKDYANGDLSHITRAFKTDGWVSSLVADNFKANIQSSIGLQYNPDFEIGYKRFQAFNKASKAMAMAYLGNLYTPLLNYDRLVSGGRGTTPTMAFAQAFSNPAQYSSMALPEGATTSAAKAIKDHVAGKQATTLFGVQLNPFSRANLNKSGEQAMQNAFGRQLAVMSANSDVPPEDLIPQLEGAAIANGTFERYGQLAWTNAQGSDNLGQRLHLMQDEADEIIPAVIDLWLKKSGNKAGAGGNSYDIRRFKDARGNMVLAVRPEDDDADGYQSPVLIPFSAFKDAANGVRASRVAKAKPPEPSRYNKVDAYRRIPGETGAQRLSRINREVAAGANPAKALPLKQ